MKEEHRDRRSVRWIEMGVRDFRIAVRTLGRAPSFVASDRADARHSASARPRLSSA